MSHRKTRKSLSRVTTAVVEMLESRRLLTTIALTGTPGNDTFTISLNGANYEFTGSTPTTAPVPASEFNGFTINGGGGDDTLTIQSGSVTLVNDAGSGGTNMSITVAAVADTTIKMKATQRLVSLTVGNLAVAHMVANGSRILVINNSLDLNTQGRLNLHDNSLMTTSGNAPLSTVVSYIVSGRNNGLWNGYGILSGTAGTSSPANTTLGALSGAQYISVNSTSFVGQTVQSTYPALVKYTYYGNTDFSDTVNFDDYSRTDAGFNGNRTGWLNGDFNYDNVVNFDDYSLIDLAFNSQVGAIKTLGSNSAYHFDPLGDNAGDSAVGSDGTNPMELGYFGPVKLADGTVSFTSADLAPSELGELSGHTRTWNSDPQRSAGSTNGGRWALSQWPVLKEDTATHLVQVVEGGRATRYFDFTAGLYTARSFSPDKLNLIAGNDLQLLDSMGNSTYFRNLSATDGKAGRILKYVDAGGNTTEFFYEVAAPYRLDRIERKIGAAGAVLEELKYAYFANGRLEKVTMRRRDEEAANALVNVRSVTFSYYESNGEFGMAGDLKLVTVKEGTPPAEQTVEQKFYRYYPDGRLKYVIEGASYERMLATVATPETAQDFQIEPFADYAFEYYGPGSRFGKVSTLAIKGAGTYTFDYGTPGTLGSGTNAWRGQTFITIPHPVVNDPTVNDKREVYTNAGGEVLADAFLKNSTGNPWVHAYKYDAVGRLTHHANPSAASAILVGQAHPATISSNSGLVDRFTYLSGGVTNGYLDLVGVSQGETTALITIHDYAYGSTRPVSGMPLLTEDKTYQTVSTTTPGSPSIVTYQYPSFTAGEVATKNTVLPQVTHAQNGSNSMTEQVVETFDAWGRVLTTTDADTFMKTFTYEDSTGAMQTASEPSSSGALTTTTVSDGLGRARSITDPEGHSTTIEFIDNPQVRRVITLRPQTTASAPASSNPVAHILRDDRRNGVVDDFEVVRVATGPGPQVVSRTRTRFDVRDLPISMDRYEDTSGVEYDTGTGVLTVNGPEIFYRTFLAHDERGRQVREAVSKNVFAGSEAVAQPTITKTVYDRLDRVIETWIGTDDSVATSNMTKISENVYDGGPNSVGNGNLTRTTQFPKSDGSENRITDYRYDWRDRLVLQHSGKTSTATINSPITFCTYDNLDRCVATRIYDGDGQDINLLGNLDTIDSTLGDQRRRAFDETLYDNRGRIFQTKTYSVDQTTGAVGGSLTSDTWYDNRGNIIKSKAPGGLVHKNVYDGASRVISEFITDGGGDALPGATNTWDHARNVNDDRVLEQSDTEYDRNDNWIFRTTGQRNHDSSALGGLSVSNARISFVANWYDSGNRLRNTVNWGNNRGVEITSRPTDPPGRAVANAYDPHLRVDYVYLSGAFSGAGEYVEQVIDPKGIVMETQFDALGYKSAVWEARTGTAESPTPSVDTNRGTKYLYNGFGAVTLKRDITSQGAGTRTYDINYFYGISKGGNNQIGHSGLLNEILYGPTTGSNGAVTDHDLFNGYNAMGEVTHHTQRNTATHVFTYSTLGQQLSDEWTNPGAAFYAGKISTWAKKLTFGFDTLGRGTRFTTLDGGTTKNEVIRSFDGLGNLLSERTTINEGSYFNGPTALIDQTVSYEYDTNFATTANYSRLRRTIYPNTRSAWVGYGSAGSLNDRISRVETLGDSSTPSNTTTLESDYYLGLDRIVRRRYDAFRDSGQLNTSRMGESVHTDETWTLDEQDEPDSGRVDDAGLADRYNGLDRFGRVIEQAWGNFGSTLGVSRTYAYDANSNPLIAFNPKSNFGNEVRSEVFSDDGAHASSAHDKLGRSPRWARGEVSASGTRLDTVKSPSATNNWAVDSNGNFDRQTSPDRVAFQGTIPGGNQPSPGSPRTDVFFRFDGFGRVAAADAAQLTQNGGNWTYDTANRDERDYEYDALGRRILERTRGINAAEQFSRFLFHDVQGRVVEEQRRFLTPGSSPAKTYEQYVWSAAITDRMIVRDRNADDDEQGPSGSYGVANSGLEERFWVQQGPDGSVWQIWKQTETGAFAIADSDTFLYTPEGDLTVIHGVDTTPDAVYSRYDWKYLWHGMRAAIYPAADGFGTNRRYDGLLWDWQTNETHDTKRGTPLAEDVYAYTTTSGEHIKWNHQQTAFLNAGTSGAWSKPARTSRIDHSEPSWWGPFFGSLASDAKAAPGAVWSGVKEIGLRAADVSNDQIYFVTTLVDAAVGSDPVNGFQFYKGSLSALGQAIDNGQTTRVNATVAGIPIVSGSVEAYTGRSLITGDRLNTAERWGRSFGAISDAAFAGAGGLKVAGYNPTLSTRSLQSLFRRAPLDAISNRAIDAAIRGNITAAQIADELVGTTAQANRVASAIRQGRITVNILEDAAFESARRHARGRTLPPGMRSEGFTVGRQIYLRRGDPRVFARAVHEGTHVLDYRSGVRRSRQSLEKRARFHQRAFDIATGQQLQYPHRTIQEMLEFVRANYP